MNAICIAQSTVHIAPHMHYMKKYWPESPISIGSYQPDKPGLTLDLSCLIYRGRIFIDIVLIVLTVIKIRTKAQATVGHIGKDLSESVN